MNKAFTLIELSIVLVIIGLLIGGILVAQSMIQVAKRNTLITEFQQLSIAIEQFKLKYGCAPGDCRNTHFGFANGDGNGYWSTGAELSTGTSVLRLTGYDPGIPPSGAVARFASKSGGAFLLDFSNVRDATTSRSGTSGDIWPINDIPIGTQLIGIMDGNVYWPTGALSAVGFLTVEQAMSIDIKLDDGLPRKGKVWASHYPFGGMPHASCITATWNTQNKDIRCGLLFVLP